MANNYVYHSETVNEEEGACALELGNMQSAAMENETEEQDHQQQHLQQQLQLQQQQSEMQQFDAAIARHQNSGVPDATTLGPTLNSQTSKVYTSIALQGQKIKSKLNPLAPEFYPSYKRVPKNGYVINPSMQQMPNAAAMAAAATAAQYGFLDYDCGYADWPTYEYDVARYMDYERFMTSHMQRSNTAVTLVRNNYSGSGSGAPASGSTSFQDQQSYENLRQKRSFNRSFSGTSYNFRKHKNSKEVSRENMRSWYIDKKAEEKRMESWKNITAETSAYQDVNMPVTSSKEEYFECEVNGIEKIEKQDSEYQREQSQSLPPPNAPPIIVEDRKQQQQHYTARPAGGTTESTPRKVKNQRKLRKENTEMTKKKLIMLYPSKRNVSDLLQSSQDSMFTQPNPIEYTSDESFLTQLSSSQLMESEIDKILREVKGQEIEIRNEQQIAEADQTDSLEDFEMTTKPSEPKIIETSQSVSPISVIAQEKPRKPDKIIKPCLEPRTAVNRPRRESRESERITAQKQNRKSSHSHKYMLSTSTTQKSIPPSDSTYSEQGATSHADTDTASHKEKPAPKTIITPKGRYFANAPDDINKSSQKTARSAVAHTTGSGNETPKTVCKPTRCPAGAEGAAATSKPSVYTGAIPKTKERENNKAKEAAAKETQPSSPTTTISKPVATKSSVSGAVPKVRETAITQSRKIPTNSGEAPALKTSRGSTLKSSAAASTMQKDEKTKQESWVQRPPNGIVANRMQIFANSSKATAAAKSEASHLDATHKRLVSTLKTPASSEKRASKSTGEPATPKPTTMSGSMTQRKPTATSTHVAAASAAATERRSTVQKSIVKTQMRTAINQETIHSSSKRLSSTPSPLTPKKETADTKKSKSIVAGSNRSSVLATSSKSIKTPSTKIPLREKSSSLRGVKAVIGSDGDKNAAKVKSSRSCISLRPAPNALVKKPSATSTKVSKKSPTTAVNHKKHSEAIHPASTLRSLQKEKQRNPYSDPGADYKIVQSTCLQHK